MNPKYTSELALESNHESFQSVQTRVISIPYCHYPSRMLLNIASSYCHFGHEL
jgi:hypothetical protein